MVVGGSNFGVRLFLISSCFQLDVVHKFSLVLMGTISPFASYIEVGNKNVTIEHLTFVFLFNLSPSYSYS